MIAACSKVTNQKVKSVPTTPGLTHCMIINLLKHLGCVWMGNQQPMLNNDVITYQLQVAKDNQFTQIVKLKIVLQ
jgi:hypothetical protein